MFFTEIDPRARVKGSRDPVGAQAVWATLGRPLVGNLTTVTTSVRGFTTLLIGLRLADRAVEQGKADSVVDAFLVWEQIAAYARHVCHGEYGGFFGYRRVAARAQKGMVRLSADPDGQILGNQKSYGLWGLYSSPARVSGMVAAGTPTRLAGEAAAFVDATYIPRLAAMWGRDAGSLVEFISKRESQLNLASSNSRFTAVASVLQPDLAPAEAAFFRRHLVQGGPEDPTGGRQSILASLMLPGLADVDWLSRSYIVGLADNAARAGNAVVSELLRAVAASESVLAPATELYSHLLTRDGATLSEIADSVREAWGARLDSVDPAAASAMPTPWAPIAIALADGDYAEALHLLLSRNAAVMRERGGAAPWAQLGDDGRVKVRFRDEPGDLPDGDTVREFWKFPYFIPSLRSVLRTTEGVAG